MTRSIGLGTSTTNRGIVAQISAYPMDARHVEYLLPHQINVWERMVDRIVITIDTRQSRSGRYRGSAFEENLVRLRRSVAAARRTCPKLTVIDVDYGDAMQKQVGRFFFGTDRVPVKAWDGGPFYAYFFGLFMANARYVMHFDADMLFGGGSTTWVSDAISCLDAQPTVLFAAPFPGPPRADGKIIVGSADKVFGPIPERLPHMAYRYAHVSTRAFLIDLERFCNSLGAFDSVRPSAGQRIKSRLLGNPPDTREAEAVMSHTLRRSGFRRVDLLGESPGLWSLHPPYRGEEFYAQLPDVIHAVETGQVPQCQRGHYDVNDSMIDWTAARAADRRHRRYVRMLWQRVANWRRE